MRKRILFLGSILLGQVMALGQDYSRQSADSMLALLKKNNQDATRIGLLLDLAQFHIFKPGENKIDFDSATVYINEAAALNKTLRSPAGQGYQLLTEAYLVKEKGNKEAGKKLVENAVAMLESGTNKLYLGKAYYELSNYYNWEYPQELVHRIELVKKAAAAFQQTNDMERKGATFQMLGDLLNIKGDNEQSVEALKLALSTFDSIHYKKMQGVYTLLARVYTDKVDFRRGLQYALLALKTAEIERDTSMQLCQINNDIGYLYNNLKEYELSIKYYKAALEVAKRYDESSSIIVLMTGISAGYNSLSRSEKAIEFLESVPKRYLRPQNDDERILMTLPYLSAYVGSKRPENGRIYCELLLRLAEGKDVDNASKSTVYRSVAGYYIKMKDFEAARKYLSKNDVYTRGLGASRLSLDLRVWCTIDSAQGRFREAYSHLMQYKRITDSIFKDTKAKQLQQLEVEYQTSKKEDSIKTKNLDILSLTQQNQLQLANLRQARLTRNITLAGVIVALIFIGLLYRLYRIKQKASTTISHKNDLLQHLVTEKEWLLKEIHHRVKNNFHTVMGLLGTQSAYLKNDIAIKAIKDSQQRIQAMSLIHQRLYQSNNLSSIKMADYIYELVDTLKDSFDSHNPIRFHLDIDSVEMDLAHCIPLGLILNEAITNSFKYAFPGGRPGDIHIQLKNTSVNHYQLTVQDNGVGLPTALNINRPDSMGMNLMRGLTTEIGGHFSLSGENGTRIEVSFVFEPASIVVNN